MNIQQIGPFVPNGIAFSSKKRIAKAAAVSIPALLAADTVEFTTTKNISDEDKKLDSLLKDFTEKLKTARKNQHIAFWELNVDSSSQKEKEYEIRQKEYFELYRNKELYKQLLEIDDTKLSEKYSRILKDLIKNFQRELCWGEEIQNLRQKENAVLNKFNSYIHTIDGKPTSLAEILRILETEKDSVLREKAYDAMIKRGDFLAEDIRKLVIERNDYAKNRGYSNYYDYILQYEYNINPEELDKLMDDIYDKTGSLRNKFKNEMDSDLKKIFGVDKLENNHYKWFSKIVPSGELNAFIQKNIDVVELSKKIFKQMGYDIDELEKSGKLTLDLYPRDNKNSHGMCSQIEAGQDARILTNTNNTILGLTVLMHELGHAIYYLGISPELNYFNQDIASEAFDESIAYITENIIRNESALDGIIPKEELKKFKDSNKKQALNFIMRMCKFTEFERDMYKNPEQDLALLWQEKSKKYGEIYSRPDNYWATTVHYIMAPVYCQNYIRSKLMEAQIYNHLRSVLGELCKNDKTSEYLRKNIFSHGSEFEDDELIKRLTGKKLSADDFIKIYT